jgi:zinc protease
MPNGGRVHRVKRMPPRTRLPAPHFRISRRVLDNGLRVLLVPDRSAPVVGITVLYDVGIRSEPQGRTGFAHLFEHLMFQGSRHLEKMAHARYVQSSGGSFNGSTHIDYTEYHEALPSNALERGLFLEADRMAGPQLTDENVTNQIAVVKEEIRVNVMNRPYGGFPWLYLPGVMYQTFPNAHNGYGDFVDLEAATRADASTFFRSYYTPSNAVLCVAGDLDLDETWEMVERHFGPLPARRTPRRPTFGEPRPEAERRGTVRDLHAPMPAIALGYRLPDSKGLGRTYLAHVLLAEVLADGDASRLWRALVQGAGLVTEASAYVGEFGDPFEERDPVLMTISAFYPDPATRDRVVNGIDDELRRVATDGLGVGELDRVRTRLVASLLRGLDATMNRAASLAKFELVHGRAELVAEVPALLSAVTAADVVTAAAALADQHRAVLDLVPGGDE